MHHNVSFKVTKFLSTYGASISSLMDIYPCTVSEIFSVKEWRDLEPRVEFVKGH